jgi:hypothetical protein
MKSLIKILTAVICLLNLSAYGQQYDAPICKFYGSITQNLPVYEKPVSVMIKVDVDHAGKVRSIDVSDSAQPFFKKKFEAAKPNFDMAALGKYIKLYELKSTSFMIPYMVTNKNAKMPTKEPLLTRFKGEDFKGKAKVLKPINSSYSVITTTTTVKTF